jgi:hypothetical protein
MGPLSTLRPGLLLVGVASLGACASARSLSAEGTGGPLVTRPTTVALLVVGNAGAELEQTLTEQLSRSRRVRLGTAWLNPNGWSLGPDSEPPTVEEACAAGRKLGVDQVVVASATSTVTENRACARSSILSKNETCQSYYETGQYTASVAATLRLVDVRSCHETASFQISGSNRNRDTEDGHSPDPVAASSVAVAAFRRELARELALLFPVGARVSATDGTRARIDRGAGDGVARGQVFGIMRAGRKIGHAVVEQVERDSATVEAFTGDAVLRPNDALAESGTTCCLEIAPVFAGLRSDVGGSHHLAAGAALQVAWYRPLDSLVVSSMLGLVGAGDQVTTVLWTADAGWVWRLLPRRLSLTLVAGGGVVDAHRSGQRATGFLGDAALGLKLRLSDNFWVTGDGAWVIATRIDGWSDPTTPLPDLELGGPMVRLGVGLRIP